MYQLNEKIRDLIPYEPIQGDYRIRLDANESFLSVPEEVAEEIRAAVSSVPFQRYPDSAASEACGAFARYHGASAENVTAGNGSDELISVLISAFLKKGDVIVTLSPDFSMYRFYSSIDEANCIELQKRENLTIDVDELIGQARGAKARMIVFSNPCNPTSLGLSREQVRRLIRSVDALVVLDEAYMDFWDQSLLGEVCDYDNLVILRTCSKAFGMAASRLGFAVANPTLTRAIRAVKSPYNVNSVTQKIGSVVLSHRGLIEESIGRILSSRAELETMLKEIFASVPGAEVYESCTNFVLVRTPDAQEIYRALMKDGIAVRLLGEFLRITAGAPDENAAVAAALKKRKEKGWKAE